MNRALVRDSGGLTKEIRQGELNTDNPTPDLIATDADHVLTAAIIAANGGYLYYSALSAGRAITTDTAAALLAAFFSNAEVGDSIVLQVSVEDAFAITWAAGVGVTLKGRATTVASGRTSIIMKKLSTTTLEWFVF